MTLLTIVIVIIVVTVDRNHHVCKTLFRIGWPLHLSMYALVLFYLFVSYIIEDIHKHSFMLYLT